MWPLIAWMVAILSLDQAIKWWTLIERPENVPLWHVGGIEIELHYVTNPGIAWSMLADYPWIVFVGRSILMLLVVRWLYLLPPSASAVRTSLGIMLGGALSNFLDQVVHGAVIDMFAITLFGWSYPVFNIADMMIVIGLFFTWCFYGQCTCAPRRASL